MCDFRAIRMGKVCPMKLAYAPRIRTIDFSISGINGTGSLSPRARRTLSVYVALVKMGFEGVAAPMGCIADAVYRSSMGEAGSIRTLQRAHLELEECGYIRSLRFRDGIRSKGAVIHFNLDAFAFWTQDKTRNVTPIPTPSHNVVSRETMCDKSPHTTSCHPSDRTRIESQVTPQDLPSKNKEQRAGARASQKTHRRRKNAVLYSVGVVLGKTQRIHRADRRAARARAQCEVGALRAGIALVNPSGIDWAYWEKRWTELPIEVRETTVSREILPLLLGGRPTGRENVVEETPAAPAPTAEEIRAVREGLEAAFSLPRPEPVRREVLPAPVDLPDDELSVLLAARTRARARVNSG